MVGIGTRPRKMANFDVESEDPLEVSKLDNCPHNVIMKVIILY